jgi:hypothetical protein
MVRVRKLQCYGRFYRRNVLDDEPRLFRSCLEIKFCSGGDGGKTLIVIYMNPGGGTPLGLDGTNDIPLLTESGQISTQAKVIPAMPDATHAQTVLLMHLCRYKRAIVLNLSDICEGRSNQLPVALSRVADNLPRWDSIFHSARSEELERLAGSDCAVIGGWGSFDRGNDCLSLAAINAVKFFGASHMLGDKKKVLKRLEERGALGFYHPRPTPNGYVKPPQYQRWRKCVAAQLGASTAVQRAASAMYNVDLCVRKEQIWTDIDQSNGTMNIDITQRDPSPQSHA